MYLSKLNLFIICKSDPVIEQAISGASEATIAVLRIDDVLWAKQEIGVPDDVQAKLDGTAPDRR